MAISVRDEVTCEVHNGESVPLLLAATAESWLRGELVRRRQQQGRAGEGRRIWSSL